MHTDAATIVPRCLDASCDLQKQSYTINQLLLFLIRNVRRQPVVIAIEDH